MANDTISRQAAIDALNAEGITKNMRAHRRILSLPSAERWIPVTDGLPDDVQIGEEYPDVVFCTKEKTYTGFYEYYLGGRWWTDYDEVVDGVIAWMPLPKPYKEGEEEC